MLPKVPSSCLPANPTASERPVSWVQARARQVDCWIGKNIGVNWQRLETASTFAGMGSLVGIGLTKVLPKLLPKAHPVAAAVQVGMTLAGTFALASSSLIYNHQLAQHNRTSDLIGLLASLTAAGSVGLGVSRMLASALQAKGLHALGQASRVEKLLAYLGFSLDTGEIASAIHEQTQNTSQSFTTVLQNNAIRIGLVALTNLNLLPLAKAKPQPTLDIDFQPLYGTRFLDLDRMSRDEFFDAITLRYYQSQGIPTLADDLYLPLLGARRQYETQLMGYVRGVTPQQYEAQLRRQGGLPGHIELAVEDYKKRQSRFEVFTSRLKAKASEQKDADLDQQIAKHLELIVHSKTHFALQWHVMTTLADQRGHSWQDVVALYRQRHSDYQKALMARIDENGGAMSFDAYFQAAMYDPEFGVYTTMPADKLIHPTPDSNGAIFSTNSIYPQFAHSVTLQLRQFWDELGRPDDFAVVEMGAGQGTLARDILDKVAEQAEGDDTWQSFHRSLRYEIVEISPELARAQAKNLGDRSVTIHQTSAIDGKLPIVENGVFLSNELIDMFAPQKLVKRDGQLYEGFMVNREGVLQEGLGPVSPRAQQYMNDLEIVIPEGSELYIQPDITDWIGNLKSSLKRGFVLSIDYARTRTQQLDSDEPMFTGTHRNYRVPRWLTSIGMKPVEPRQTGLKVTAISDSDSLGYPVDNQSYQHSPTGVYWPKDMTVYVDSTAVEKAFTRHGFSFREAPHVQEWATSLGIGPPNVRKLLNHNVWIAEIGKK